MSLLRKKNLSFVAGLLLFVMVGLVAGSTTAIDDQNLRITKKPRATAKGCDGQGGKATAKVTFQSDGKVGEVTIAVADKCTAFNESVFG